MFSKGSTSSCKLRNMTMWILRATHSNVLIFRTIEADNIQLKGEHKYIGLKELSVKLIKRDFKGKSGLMELLEN